MPPTLPSLVVLLLPSALLAQSPVIDDTTHPPVRAHHAAAYHPGLGGVLVTGGSSPRDAEGQRYAMYDDTWRFDGQQWALLSHSDRRMSGMRLAWDSRRNRMLSFGGWNAGVSFGDLRVLEDGRWRVLGTLAGMPTTEGGFVYDARRDRLVLFGGGPDSATWQHDGAQWSRWEGHSPPPRQAHLMVYDEQRSRTVLYGGIGNAPRGTPPPRFDDTWEFDGDAWRRIEVSGPGPRFAAGGTYDSRRGLVLLFGGIDDDGTHGDLWAFDGSAWRKLSDDGPPVRSMGGLAYDAARDRVVLFGGRRGWPDDLNDTWEWDGHTWTEIRP